MDEIVIVDAVRTPIGRRNGGLSTVHPADLLGRVQAELIERVGIDASEVGQVIGGCVSQAGEQAYNIVRTAWLAAGLPSSVAASTVDAQCGSGQQAANLAVGLLAAGTVDVALACGVESMSRVPLGSSGKEELGLGVPYADSAAYRNHYEHTSQFEGAERIAQKWGITRDDADAFGLLSQQNARRAWDEGRFGSSCMQVEVVDAGGDGARSVVRDEGLRDTSLERLATLSPVADGVHTAGNSSQISDGAAALVLMSAKRAAALGVRPRARVVDTCLVGSDPVLMLTGPIEATDHLLRRNGLTIDDIDVFEINEAFASVVLAWQREAGADPARTNPNGGAIALGHPLGATGAVLISKALAELERTKGRYALVSMCCGGGLGTGTLIERA